MQYHYLFNLLIIWFMLTMCLISVLGHKSEMEENDVHEFHTFNLHLVNFTPPLMGLGAQMEPKIVGGTPVPIERYPYAVVLHNAGALCAGSILNSYSVLTAAHCFQFNNDVFHMTIHVGAQLYNDNAEVYDVRKLVVHPNYNEPIPFANDIALMFLIKQIKFSRRVQRAILINSGNWMNEKEKDFTVTGWGLIKYKGPVSDMGLLMTKLHYVNRTRCGKLHSLTLTPDMFCLYGDAQRDTCSGDSGGGVIWRGLLVGIVSHGDGCAGLNKPSVYSNVWHFRQWIENTIKAFLRDHCGLPSRSSRQSQNNMKRISIF